MKNPNQPLLLQGICRLATAITLFTTLVSCNTESDDYFQDSIVFFLGDTYNGFYYKHSPGDTIVFEVEQKVSSVKYIDMSLIRNENNTNQYTQQRGELMHFESYYPVGKKRGDTYQLLFPIPADIPLTQMKQYDVINVDIVSGHSSSSGEIINLGKIRNKSEVPMVSWSNISPVNYYNNLEFGETLKALLVVQNGVIVEKNVIVFNHDYSHYSNNEFYHDEDRYYDTLHYENNLDNTLMSDTTVIELPINSSFTNDPTTEIYQGINIELTFQEGYTWFYSLNIGNVSAPN
ncbi:MULTISPECIES: hypothetical protein [Reichenbachiella]|uniref:Uncharacterized protein n=1 Tax=Reichenbachiella agariperforans TaxID=156994 RepID=A0A1M6JE33_REIAG|nr:MULTISPECIES: hypothetical protein [Reichenbachiella]RJE74839.1 hypothetical protein BGP76_17075 [Reichenbachiella sp. MSK19-1]SHJ44967.1 hypothetical protein SAMN04488028_101157 [Reichenbachiella agariperforans]